MAEITEPFSRGRMGRPPLGIVATKVQLRADQLPRIDALAGGDKHRSKWIRQAIDEKLSREEAAKRSEGDGEG